MKPFLEMTYSDYADLGLKAGLEIHQQLNTEKKLFCRCPAGHYSQTFDAEILRHMRPTLSELGEYDGTALMEFKTKKEIIYQINHKTVCTYEMDDTPPFEINQQALDIALETAILLNYKLVDEIHIARKQYLDGSIPTGFQRTTIVGIDGWIPFKEKRIGLIQLGLEEDACREVSDFGHQRVFLTDRLGMPLIEMVTRPEMQTPQEVAEVANRLRWLIRSTGKVRTGIGAARQDVNVSITGGTRVEIKGVYRIPLIPMLVYNEAHRQNALLKIKDELLKRGITEKTFRAFNEDVTNLLVNSTWDPIRLALKRREEIHCVRLQNYSGILSYPTQTGKVFSREISDRVRVIACLSHLPNILTSENTEETIDSYLWEKIRKTMNTTSRDSLILVWGSAEDVRLAVKEIMIRAREATQGVPNETRQALADGTNGFERILPGPDRMYPDTDLPPLEIDGNRLKKIEKIVPEHLWTRIDKYKAWNVPKHLWISIGISPQADLFEQIINGTNIKPGQIVRLMFEARRNWQRKNLEVKKLGSAQWHLLFSFADEHEALIEAAIPLLEKYLLSNERNLEKYLKKFLAKSRSEQKLNADITSELNKIPENLEYSQYHKYLMGRLMPLYRGYVRGERVSTVLADFLNESAPIKQG